MFTPQWLLDELYEWLLGRIEAERSETGNAAGPNMTAAQQAKASGLLAPADYGVTIPE